MSEKEKEKEKDVTVAGDPKVPEKVIRVEHTIEVKGEKATSTPSEKDKEKNKESPSDKGIDGKDTPSSSSKSKEETEAKDGDDELTKLKKEKEDLEAEIGRLRLDEANPELEGSKANIAKKLEERTNALAVIATQEFEVEKQRLLETAKESFEASGVPKEEMDKKLKEIDEKIDDPTMLETVKTTMSWLMPPKVEDDLEDGTEKVPPAGKAKGKIPEDVYKDHKQVIDDICAILDDPTKTQAEKAEAEKKWNELFFELYKGVKQARAVTPTFSFTTCPQCNQMIPASSYRDGIPESCSKCGWKQQRTRVRR